VADDAEGAGSQSPGPGEPADAERKQKPWRPWTIAVAAPLALLVSLLLALGDLLAGVLSNLGGEPAPITTFVDIAVAGHGVLALTSVFLFGIGIANAARRRPAVVAELAIIPVAIGWFALWGRLAAG